MVIVKPRILNNLLKWDGSHLGYYVGSITQRWSLDGIRYLGITLPLGWDQEIPSGVIYCIAIRTKDLLPCIIEGIKEVFGLQRCGIHIINLDGYQYVIYYVPITTSGTVIWETPINRLDSKHQLRKDPVFRKEVQKHIVFCDILSLGRTGETQIRIRPGNNGIFVPISMNETMTTIVKASDYDYSIINKTLFTKWFGEETCISSIVKEMVNYNKRGATDNLAIVSADLRMKIDEVIKRYDSNYVWYSNFIIDRMSRYLLVL